MINKVNASLLILTHRNKILLMLRDNKSEIRDPNKWSFFGGVKEENESFEQTAIRELMEETGLNKNTVTFVASIEYNNRQKYFYHISLTDDDVDNLQLFEGQKMEFFTLDEMYNLPLAVSTKLFLEKHVDILLKINKN